MTQSIGKALRSIPIQEFANALCQQSATMFRPASRPASSMGPEKVDGPVDNSQFKSCGDALQDPADEHVPPHRRLDPASVNPYSLDRKLPDWVSRQLTNLPKWKQREVVETMFTSGKGAAVIPLNVGERLVKLVPSGQQPNPASRFYTTPEQARALLRDPQSIADRLALPPSSHAPKYDIYAISCETATVCVVSKVAQTTVGGRPCGAGGAQQVQPLWLAHFSPPGRIAAEDL